jgi:hypothetical protein
MQLLMQLDINSCSFFYSEVGASKKKEVIHPHLPVGIPCYDFIMVTNITVDAALLRKG